MLYRALQSVVQREIMNNMKLPRTGGCISFAHGGPKGYLIHWLLLVSSTILSLVPEYK